MFGEGEGVNRDGRWMAVLRGEGVGVGDSGERLGRWSSSGDGVSGLDLWRAGEELISGE